MIFWFRVAPRVYTNVFIWMSNRQLNVHVRYIHLMYIYLSLYISLTYSIFLEIYVFMDRWNWYYVSVNTSANKLSSQVSNIASCEQIWRTECEWTLGICSYFDPIFNLNITFNSYIYIMLTLLWINECFNMTYKLYIKTWHNISIYFTIIKLSRLLIDPNTFYTSNIHYYYHHHKLHFPSSKTFGGKIFSWKGYRAACEWKQT